MHYIYAFQISSKHSDIYLAAQSYLSLAHNTQLWRWSTYYGRWTTRRSRINKYFLPCRLPSLQWASLDQHQLFKCVKLREEVGFQHILLLLRSSYPQTNPAWFSPFSGSACDPPLNCPCYQPICSNISFCCMPLMAQDCHAPVPLLASCPPLEKLAQ